MSTSTPNIDTKSARTWLSADLGAVGENVALIKEFIGPEVKLLTMVKGQAYGLGNAPEVAKVVLAHGADFLGVELLDEVVELRQEGILAPILMVGPVGVEDAETVVAYDVHSTVHDHGTIDKINRIARASQRTASLHLEFDTGLNRFGNSAQEIQTLALEMRDCDAVRLAGIWTHFTSSENPGADETRSQFVAYMALLAKLEDLGVSPGLRHVCNSAALLRSKDMHLDMVRCGKLVYGFPPSPDLAQALNLRPVITWKTRIRQIRSLHERDAVGYNQTWIAQRKSKVGVINAGFGDGYPARLSNRSSVLVRGRNVPIIGRICMRAMMVDLTDCPGASVGDEVVMIGQQEGERIEVQDLAERADTIPAEFLLGVGTSVHRFITNKASAI